MPPPIPEMQTALDALERRIHAPSEISPVVRIALIHYQFETIHPFMDGSDRNSQLLVILLLIEIRVAWRRCRKPGTMFQSSPRYIRWLICFAGRYILYHLCVLCHVLRKTGQKISDDFSMRLLNTPDQRSGCFCPIPVDLNQDAAPVRRIGLVPDEPGSRLSIQHGRRRASREAGIKGQYGNVVGLRQ